LVEIARAVVGRPRVLLLDEPAAGLSLDRIDAITELIRRINKDLNITVILVEHVLNVVMEVSSTVTVMNAGAKLFEGTPMEARASHDVQTAYLGKAA
jgi:branched-chain amino acid transport system ATP-binding protein